MTSRGPVIQVLYGGSKTGASGDTGGNGGTRDSLFLYFLKKIKNLPQ